MKVLILTPYLPHRRVGHGGGTAVRDLAAELARLHEIEVVSLLRPGEEQFVADVAKLGVDVVGLSFLDQNARGLRRAALLGDRLRSAGRAVCARHPFYVAKYGAPGLVSRIVDAVAAFDPDVVQVEYLQLSLSLRALREVRDRRSVAAGALARPRLVLNSHELSSLPRRRRAAASPNAVARSWYLAQARAWERLQVAATGWADATLCVTPQDHALLAAMGGRNLHTLPLGVDTRAIVMHRPADAPPRALFLGSFQHPPNRAAARLLLEAIWPRLKQDLPDWELLLAGPGSDSFLAGQPVVAAGVRALGFVEDLTALFAGCRLFLAPLFEGGGIKIKILEAMGRGLPVVTTPIGAEGITDGADGTAWVAADVDEFCAHVRTAASHPEEAERRALRARRHIEENFSWRAIAARLTAIYARI